MYLIETFLSKNLPEAIEHKIVRFSFNGGVVVFSGRF